MKISCEAVRLKLSEDIQLEDADALCEQVREHLSECGLCQEFHDSLDRTILCFKDYATEPPRDLHAIIMARVKREGLS